VNCVYSSGFYSPSSGLILGWGILGNLASEFDVNLAKECFNNQRISEDAILKHMYNPETKLFNHLWQAKDGSQQRYSVKTVQCLFPLLLSSLPPEALEKILTLLNDDGEFGTTYMVPSVSKAEPEYNPVANTLLLWRGPIWGFTNWFIMEGLEKHGQQFFHSLTFKTN